MTPSSKRTNSVISAAATLKELKMLCLDRDGQDSKLSVKPLGKHRSLEGFELHQSNASGMFASIPVCSLLGRANQWPPWSFKDNSDQELLANNLF